MPRPRVSLFILVIPLLVSANDHLLQFEQRIVKGSLSDRQPAIGSLLFFDNVHQRWQSTCSASLVDSSTVLTAAHCVCKTTGNNCLAGQSGAPEPKQFIIYFHNAGFFEIDSINLSERYDFPTSDYAVINLTNAVPAIEPLQLATIQPTNTSAAQLAGYGRTSQPEDSSSGLLRIGPTLLGNCNSIDLDNNHFLCWDHSPDSQLTNSCNGDSGGTLLSANGEILLGIISGGINDCEQTDTGFATAIAAIRNDILTRSKVHIASNDPTLVLDSVYSASGYLDAFTEKKYRLFVTPSNAKKIVVSSNASDTFGIQTELTVETDSATCISARPGSFQSCELKRPGNQMIDISLQNNSSNSILFQLNASELENHCNLDIDKNGTNNALTDGLLIVRALFGFQGNALINNTVVANSKRNTSEEILNYINSDSCKVAMDIDRNGSVDALTDGIVMLRYLFGIRGNDLINGITNYHQLSVFNERLTLLGTFHKTTYEELQP
ncbi:MAG: S1 family peptidase [Methylococcales bacterium]